MALPEAERAKAYDELKHGAVKMRKLDTLDNGAEIPVPGWDDSSLGGTGLYSRRTSLQDVLASAARTTTITRSTTLRTWSGRRSNRATAIIFACSCDFGGTRWSPWCWTRSTTCAISVILRRGRTAGVPRCALLRWRIPGKSDEREKTPAMTTAFCGGWIRGGGWLSGTAAFTCRARWCR